MWPSLLAVVLGVSALAVTYRLIEASWPESYMTLWDMASYRKIANPAGYALFRLIPVFATVLFVAVSLERANENPWPASLIVGVLHGWLTSGRAIGHTWHARSDPRRSPLIAMHAFVFLLVAASAIGAALSRNTLDGLIPELDSLASELWGAVLAALLAAFFIETTRSGTIEVPDLMARQRKLLGEQLMEVVRVLALEHNADRMLVEAILFTESTQRPKWFRNLERVKSWFSKSGTYGVMQVFHDGYLTDEASIRIAVAERLANTLPEDGEQLDHDQLEVLLRRYNPSEAFNSMASEFYRTSRYDAGG